jgi:hypothetical protein
MDFINTVIDFQQVIEQAGNILQSLFPGLGL